jgi:hypothetical protein
VHLSIAAITYHRFMDVHVQRHVSTQRISSG